MNIEYCYHEERGYLLCTPKGVVTLDDVKVYVQTLCNDNTINAPFIEVVDFTQTKEFDFGYFEAKELIELFEALKSSKGYKGSCLVVQEDITKSMSNLISGAGRDLGVVIKTFKTVEDACKYAEYDNT